MKFPTISSLLKIFVKEKPLALIGLHNGGDWARISKGLENRGYNVVSNATFEGMLAIMGLSRDSPASQKPIIHYGVYIMDTNLGTPGADDYRPAQTIYRHLEEDVKEGSVKFMSITHNSSLVERATYAGIPCREKLCFNLDSFFDVSK